MGVGDSSLGDTEWVIKPPVHWGVSIYMTMIGYLNLTLFTSQKTEYRLPLAIGYFATPHCFKTGLIAPPVEPFY